MASKISYSVRSGMASNSDSRDNSLSTPPSSCDESTLAPSRVHFLKTHYEIKPLAAGANGETFLAIPKKKANVICEAIGYYASDVAFFNALRSEVVVAKFAKPGRGKEGDIINEIFILQDLSTTVDGETTRLPISTLINHHQKDEKLWLTLAFAKGGDLMKFVKCSAHRPDLTLGFRWHTALKLAQAIGYLHYGVLDLFEPPYDDATAWPDAYHGDFHSGNVLLTAAGEGAYKDYPDVILADFGWAKRYTAPIPHQAAPQTCQAPPNNPPKTRAAFKSKQLTDWKSAAIIMEGLSIVQKYGKLCDRGIHCVCGRCPWADCEECSWIAKRFGKLEGYGTDEKLYNQQVQAFRNFRGATAEHTVAEALSFLRAFMATAKAHRDQHYVPLSEAARGFLGAEKVMDAELLRALHLEPFFGK